MRKFTFFLAMMVAMVTTSMAQTLEFTFNKVSASEATVTVTGNEVEAGGITATIASNQPWKALAANSQTFPNASIVCPDKNTNTMTAGNEGTITLTLNNVPEGYSFKNVTFTSVALNGSGEFQGDDANAQHVNFTLTKGETTLGVAENVKIKVNSNGGESVVLPFEVAEAYTAENGTLELKLTLSITEPKGCFYGLIKVAIDTEVAAVEPEPEPEPEPEVIPAANKLYTVVAEGHNSGANPQWAINDEGTKFVSSGDNTISTDEQKQFAFVTFNEAKYIYSISAKKFVLKDGSLAEKTGDAVEITDLGNGKYFFRFDASHNVNIGGSKQMVIDGWSAIDGGNQFTLAEAGEFDPAEALAALNSTVEVVYVYMYNGVEVGRTTVKNEVGNAYPAVVNVPFGFTANTPEGVIEAAGEVAIECALVENYPIKYAATAEEIDTWYYMQMHSNNKKYIQYLADQTYLEWADAEVAEGEEDSYTWAFVGNPATGFKLVNRAAGIEKAVCSDGSNDPALGAFADAVVWKPAYSKETGNDAYFCLQFPGSNNYMNAQSGKVAYWSDNDAGSTFLLTEREITAVEPELPALEITGYTPVEAVEKLETITITFNDEIEGTFDMMAMSQIYLGAKSNGCSFAVEGNVLTITPFNAITTPGEYGLVIPEGLITRKANGEKISLNKEITFTVKEAIAALEITGYTPTEAVESLETITITFNDEIEGTFDMMAMSQIYLGAKSNGCSFAVEGNVLTITPFNAITTPGEYPLYIPEGLITRKANGEAIALNGEITFTVAEAAPVVDYTPTYTGKMNHGQRKITSISLGEGNVYETTADEQKLQYNDVTEKVKFVVLPGAEITPVVANAGEWIHSYIYIDTDANGFTAGIEEGSDWKPTGDLVSYSFYNNDGNSDNSGWNSYGDVISGNNRNKPALPPFVAPTEPGVYRMRIKADWCNIDPMGDSDGKFGDFTPNGGQIFDVLLEVSETLPAPALEITGYTPAAAVESLKDITVTFSEEIEGTFDIMNMTQIYVGSKSNGAEFTVNGNVLNISLFNAITTDGKYALYIPEGLITRKSNGEAISLNGEIEFEVKSVERFTLEAAIFPAPQGELTEVKGIRVEANQGPSLAALPTGWTVTNEDGKEFEFTLNWLYDWETVLLMFNEPIKEVGKYTLTMPASSLKTDDGKECAAATFEFEVVVPTTIEGVEAEVENVIYDLTGRRVENATKAGIYIVNGKKVLVK